MEESVVVLMRKAPYGSVYTAEGLRSILGIGVFEVDVHVLFVDDGVYALAKGQDPSDLDMKALGDAFPTLPEFGVSKFYVHEPSLKERGLKAEDLVIDVKMVDDSGAAQVMESVGTVLPF
jgi:tRNA 2-thiouridine synthesizing protein C